MSCWPRRDAEERERGGGDGLTMIFWQKRIHAADRADYLLLPLLRSCYSLFVFFFLEGRGGRGEGRGILSADAAPKQIAFGAGVDRYIEKNVIALALKMKPMQL